MKTILLLFCFGILKKLYCFRKMQCSFGWDWGPSFPTVGIWQPMSVIGFKTLFVDRLSATIKRTKGMVCFACAYYYVVA